MTDFILWSVMLWAVVAILLHLGLIWYATICRNSNWWGSPWEAWGERLRWSLAWIIGLLFLVALLTSCAYQEKMPLSVRAWTCPDCGARRERGEKYPEVQYRVEHGISSAWSGRRR